MSFIVTFIAAVFVFSAVIAIHEFGHFMVAKLCGVQVNEFSIGMGPVLCKRVRKGTQYSIRALPVGGFVALEGEESPESKQAEERSNPSAADGGSSPDRGALGINRKPPGRHRYFPCGRVAFVMLQQNADQSGAAIVDDLFQRFLQAGAGFLRHVEELVLQSLIHQFMQALAKDV